MTEILINTLLITGASFMVVAGLGVYRFPDLLSRMHAVSKSTSFGLGCIVLALAVAFPTWSVFAKTGGILVFVFLTIPTASHLIARAAQFRIRPSADSKTEQELPPKP